MFQDYFQLGFKHISSASGYVNILLITVVFSVYSYKLWKKLLVLFTAFIAGDLLSLIFFQIFDNKPIPLAIVYLPACLILLASLLNIFQKSDNPSARQHLARYFLVILFSLSASLILARTLSSGIPGNHGLITFAYNLGLEWGELLVTVVICLVISVLVNVFNIRMRDINLLISGIGIGSSLFLILGS
ncbi:MAG: HupE/UreJ family protein [Bacteroidia bacterium]|nr:HupE/UreJ family protein [Bacteroidia bacterium]